MKNQYSDIQVFVANLLLISLPKTSCSTVLSNSCPSCSSFAVCPSCSRNSDSDYSDGEEDFYYSEIEVNMDSLSEGLSNLTPTSPTTVGPPPAFPPPLADVPHSENINVNGFQNHDAPTLLSQSAPSALCHIRTDHAYQVRSRARGPDAGTAHSWWQRCGAARCRC